VSDLLSIVLRLKRMGFYESVPIFQHFPAQLAGCRPELLEPHFHELIDAGILDPGCIYRTAGPEIRDALLRAKPWNAVWIGDEVVRAFIIARPKWRTDVSLEAGWELLPEGGRRELCFPECFTLRAPTPEPPHGVEQAAADRMTEHEASCPSCGERLLNWFDFDLTDPRLAFLARNDRGEQIANATRLRIAACQTCVNYAESWKWARTYTLVDVNGRSEVISTVPPAKRIEPMDWSRRPRRLVVGPGPLVPVAAICYMAPMSSVGGNPDWVQDASYPECPMCGRLMRFVAQADGGDIHCGDGVCYGFLCRRCWVTVAYSQQS
jgi:hypothetical protein